MVVRFVDDETIDEIFSTKEDSAVILASVSVAAVADAAKYCSDPRRSSQPFCAKQFADRNQSAVTTAQAFKFSWHLIRGKLPIVLFMGTDDGAKELNSSLGISICCHRPYLE